MTMNRLLGAAVLASSGALAVAALAGCGLTGNETVDAIAEVGAWTWLSHVLHGTP